MRFERPYHAAVLHHYWWIALVTKMLKSAPFACLKIFVPSLAALALVWACLQTASAQGGAASAPAGLYKALGTSDDVVSVLHEDAQGVVLEMRLEDFSLLQEDGPDGICQSLELDGFGQTGAAGAPGLPSRGLLLGVPPVGEPEVEILDAELVTAPGRYALCPTPGWSVEGSPGDQFPAIRAVMGRDPAAYARRAFIPEFPAEIVSTGFVRSQRVAALRLQPFQYNPGTGELRYYRRLRLQVNFLQAASPDRSGAATLDEGAFEASLQAGLLNYETARAWRVPTAPALLLNDPAPATSGPAYKLFVEQDGIVRLGYTDLSEADIPVDEIDPRKLRVFKQDLEVALAIPGEGDGVFDPGDEVLFYGQKVNTKYSGANVYWLTWGEADGLRMGERPGAPDGDLDIPTSYTATRRIEQNLLYRPTYPSGPERDHWYWNYLQATTKPVQNLYTINLDCVSTQPVSATLRGLFKSYSGVPQHHTRIYVNDHLVQDAYWPDGSDYLFEASFDQGFLVEGDNVIKLLAPLDGGVTQDIFFVNWFEVGYARSYQSDQDELQFSAPAGDWELQVSGFRTSTVEVLDISDPRRPVCIKGVAVEPEGLTYRARFTHSLPSKSQYLAYAPSAAHAPQAIQKDIPSDLHNSANGVDYIILTHADFYTAVLPLAEFHAAQGLRVQVVDVQDVYDEFSSGVFDPGAIRDFLAYAYTNWKPHAPSYVLLVGDGNYDFRNYLGYGEPNYVPPFLDDVDPWIGETATDNRYVMLSGDDVLPDMHLGRLPARTEVEAAAMVAKILAYEGLNPLAIEDWTGQALFVADNSDETDDDFAAYSNVIADDYLPNYYSSQKVYYKVNYSDKTAARAAIIEAINQGRLFVNYIGHAAIQSWASENLFDIHAIANLTNGLRMPFMLPMTCLDGYFIYPSPPGYDYSSLGESVVRAAAKGAVASFSPSGLGVAPGHDFLEKGVFTAIFQQGLTQFGPATTQAKLYLYANSGGKHHDLIETYLLFGDPAARLQIYYPDKQYLPLVAR
jgi:hypothetical protein